MSIIKPLSNVRTSLIQAQTNSHLTPSWITSGNIQRKSFKEQIFRDIVKRYIPLIRSETTISSKHPHLKCWLFSGVWCRASVYFDLERLKRELEYPWNPLLNDVKFSVLNIFVGLELWGGEGCWQLTSPDQSFINVFTELRSIFLSYFLVFRLMILAHSAVR